MKTASGRSAARVSFLIFLVGLWEFVIRAADIPTYVIPAPSEVAVTITRVKHLIT